MGLALPINVYLAAWTLAPLLYLLYLSLTNWKVPNPRRFIWFGNYIEALGDPLFRHSVRVTFSYAFGVAALEVAIGLFVALLLHRRGWLSTVTRSLFVVPMVLTPVVTAMMWRALLNPSFGPMNWVLGLVGFGPYEWHASPDTVWASLVMIDVWQWLPFPTLLILSGLMSLPDEPYEASQVDGASWGQQLRHLTLPMLRPIMVAAFFLRFLDALKVFDTVFVLTRGGPGTMTEVLSFHIYRFGLGEFFRLGYGSALSVLVVLMTGVLAFTVLRSLLKEPITHA